MTLAGRTKKEWYDQWIEMTPMGRCGEPWEIAATALFLAADASGFFTGAILGPDGGYTAW
jgi:galactitol 2-dehydrogenase (L-tagatose-forming)